MTSERTPAESRRWRTLMGGLVVLAVGIGAGVAGSILVKSPESAALENAAPSLPPATTKVEVGVLGESLIVDAEFALSGDRIVPASDHAGIVTAAPDLGAVVSSGSVVLEVSGRPIIALAGDLFPYRDFTGGTRGDDVRILQAALVARGFDPGPQDGLYGAKTAAAVKALYAALGYEAPVASASAADVQAARAQVSAATAALRDLTLAAADPADIAVAAATLSLAKEDLSSKRDAALTPLPSSEVVFLDGESFEVVESGASRGSPATAGLVVLASGTSRTLWATVSRSVAARLTTGDSVVVTAVSSGGTSAGPDAVGGTVTWIASVTGTGGTRERFGAEFAIPNGQVGIEMTLEAPITRRDVARLSATIHLGADGPPTLIVPLSALRASGDGGSWVAVLTENEAGELVTREVEVTVLDSLSGRASVRSQDLHVGDDVVIP